MFQNYVHDINRKYKVDKVQNKPGKWKVDLTKLNKTKNTITHHKTQSAQSKKLIFLL